MHFYLPSLVRPKICLVNTAYQTKVSKTLSLHQCFLQIQPCTKGIEVSNGSWCLASTCWTPSQTSFQLDLDDLFISTHQSSLARTCTNLSSNNGFYSIKTCWLGLALRVSPAWLWFAFTQQQGDPLEGVSLNWLSACIVWKKQQVDPQLCLEVKGAALNDG